MKFCLSICALIFFTSLKGFAAPATGVLDFASVQFQAHWSWLVQPDGSNKESRLRLDWTDSKGNAVEPLNFQVVPWMPSMGHGSAPTQIQRMVDENGEIITGSYEVRNIYFIMPGEWEIQVRLANSLGNIETQSWMINLPGDHSGHPPGHGHHH